MLPSTRKAPGEAGQEPRKPPLREVSPLILNRLSVYLRCLRLLQESGVARVSSLDMAQRFLLSAPQIRKDLAQFGEFGIRGVGYDVDQLAARLTTLLGLDRRQRILVVGMGSLGSALARHVGFNRRGFSVVAGLDNDPAKVGSQVGHLTVEDTGEAARVIRRTGARLAMLTVPAAAAQSTYEMLVDAGIRGVLNFAPVRLKQRRGVLAKNVDFRIDLEELVFFLSR